MKFNINIKIFYFAALILALSIASCAKKKVKPDLARLYKTSYISYETPPPVILIHGIMGSKLRDKSNLKELWFGSLKDLLFSNYSDIGLKIDPQTLDPIPSELEPYKIADKAAGTDYYQAVIHTLENFGNYKLTNVDEEISDFQRRLYIFKYDWRQDNVKSAQNLYKFIEKIKAKHNNSNLKVDIVAHSMGGLVSRYYLRYGDVDVLNDNEFPVNLKGAKNVRNVILLGTPNLGSVGAVESFISGLKIGLRKIPTEVLVTMPSVYQLFPHSISDWLINIDGEPLDRDVFDSDIWESFQWSIYNPKVQERILKKFDDASQGKAYIELLKSYFHKHLERARRFLWSLTVPIENTPYKIIVMGGDCSLTASRLLVEEVDGVSVTRLHPNQIKRPKVNINYEKLMFEPGDGEVTKSSLLAKNTLDPTAPQHKFSFFPLAYPYFLCEDHSTLTSNINFEDNLLNILLTK
jgi:pimeloyl-ACP methyl ester carboxylesterase